MTKKKRLQELESRVDRLEAEFNSLLVSLTPNKGEDSTSPSYEEVIDLWLNGKETS